MSRVRISCLVIGLLCAACGEKVQTTPVGNERKAATGNWRGTDNLYRVPGWTPGDQASWEAHLRARTQGQNDYVAFK